MAGRAQPALRWCAGTAMLLVLQGCGAPERSVPDPASGGDTAESAVASTASSARAERTDVECAPLPATVLAAVAEQVEAEFVIDDAAALQSGTPTPAMDLVAAVALRPRDPEGIDRSFDLGAHTVIVRVQDRAGRLVVLAMEGGVSPWWRPSNSVTPSKRPSPDPDDQAISQLRRCLR